jgi:hypothetical protein
MRFAKCKMENFPADESPWSRSCSEEFARKKRARQLEWVWIARIMSENFFEEKNLENGKELRREDRFGGEGWVGKSGSWAAALPKKEAA